jgi:polyisoprenoid-binding protein YceI
MKTLPLSLLILLTGLIASAQYKPTDQGSTIQFKIKNFGFSVSGSFTGLQGEMVFDPNNLSSCSFDVSIDANSINTDNGMRDDHLREESYFDVKNYPRIRFVSTKVTPSNKQGTLFIFGKLTIKKQTKEISFPFTATPADNGYIFKGAFKINRRDFDVGGSSTISDNLEVDLNILGKKY